MSTLSFSLHSSPLRTHGIAKPLRFSPAVAQKPPSLLKTSGAASVSAGSLICGPRRAAATITMCHHPSRVPTGERLLSSLAYAFPFLRSLHYARYLLPAASFRRLPDWASLAAHVALRCGVVWNPSFSQYARFNAAQAVILGALMGLAPMPPPGRLIDLRFGAVFLIAAACYAYGAVSCAFGRLPRLPMVAFAADVVVSCGSWDPPVLLLTIVALCFLPSIWKP